MIRVLILALFASATAFSAAASFNEIDTNGDGRASLSELIVLFPGVTCELFKEIDLDLNGYLNEEELSFAIDCELFAEPEGDL
jgi:Ca2+-binding EF-hand superfamily protein